jgi:hypothetical protein
VDAGTSIRVGDWTRRNADDAGGERVRRNNPAYLTRKYGKRRLARIALVKKLKTVPCADCGVSYPYYVMDFDHRDPETKIGNISKMKVWNKGKLLAEVAKCDVVCANCHRERTHRQNHHMRKHAEPAPDPQMQLEVV